MTMTARQAVPSLCARRILETRASPILFSIRVPSTSVDEMKNWFSARREKNEHVSDGKGKNLRAHLTNVDEVVAELDRLDVGGLNLEKIKRSEVSLTTLTQRQALRTECSMCDIPIDQGPTERQI
jgi:hypothetical protein